MARAARKIKATMTTVNYGKFKLGKQTGTTAHFAQVTVKVEPSSSDTFTISAPMDSIRRWRAPALAGAAAAISELRERRVIEAAYVEITDFVGLPTDTSDADAKWATFMAVVSAFPDAELPTLRLSTDQKDWVLAWPQLQANSKT
jgi:hypothetical protein